jgi:hypothetical protein
VIIEAPRSSPERQFGPMGDGGDVLAARREAALDVSVSRVLGA